jgi:hypothetical protein
MSHNAKGAMTEHSKLNPMTRLWMRIDFSSILSEKLNEYNKLADIAMVQVLGLLRMKERLTIFLS